MESWILRGSGFGCLSLFLFISIAQTAQIDPILKKDFPELTNRMTTGQPADFVIVIDKSKSMTSLWDTVKKGISSFIEAIPDGDYISLIAFGIDTRHLTIPCPVNQSTRNSLLKEVRKKVEQPTDMRTDLGKAFEKTLDELNRPGGNKLKFIFFLTDFKHQPPEGSQYYGTRNSNDAVWQRLVQRCGREQQGNVLQVFALLLPLGAEVGRDITLGKALFPELEQVNVNQHTLLPWFERRKAEIARDKLRAFVRNDSQKVPFEIEEIYIRSGIFGGNGKMYASVNPVKGRIVDAVALSFLNTKLNGKGVRQEEFEIKPESAQNISLEPSMELLRVPLASVKFLHKPIIRTTKVIDDTTVEIEGVQRLSPSIEIQKLNLPTDVSFSVASTLPLKVSYGYIPLALLIGLASFIVVTTGGVVYYRRPEYVSGEFAVLGYGARRVQSSEKREAIAIGNAQASEGIPVPNASWRLVMQAFRSGKQVKHRGLYVKMEKGQGTLIHKGERQSITPLDWVRVYRGCTIEVGSNRISFS